MTELDLQPTRFKKFLNMAFMFKKQDISEKKIVQEIIAPQEERLESSIPSEEQKERKAKQLELKEKLDVRFDELVSQKDKNKVVLILELGYDINSTQALNLMKDEFKHPVIQKAILNKYNESIRTELKDEVEALLNYDLKISVADLRDLVNAGRYFDKTVAKQEVTNVLRCIEHKNRLPEGSLTIE